MAPLRKSLKVFRNGSFKKKEYKLVFHNGSFKKKVLQYFVLAPLRKEYKLVIHNGSFKKKVLKYWYSKAEF